MSEIEKIKIIFSQDIDDPLLYDVLWNTETVPIEEAARSGVNLVQAKAYPCPLVH